MLKVSLLEVNTVIQNIAKYCLALCLAISTSANAQVIFLDSFESGGLSARIWSGSASTSVSSGASKSGDYSLRFNYKAGQSFSEQSFDFGDAYRELWVGYWIKMPDNYYRGSGSGNQNNKWFDILMGSAGDYENSKVARIEMQDWPGGPGKGDMLIQFRNSDGQWTNSSRYKGFLDPANAGRWMHIVYHLKASSSTTSKDGIIRMYRRWDGASSYELINELVNLNVGVTSSGRPGWSSGYLMGYYNVTFSQDTDWYLDDFTYSTTSLLGKVLAPPSPPLPR
jgi:hypothetical protein